VHHNTSKIYLNIHGIVIPLFQLHKCGKLNKMYILYNRYNNNTDSEKKFNTLIQEMRRKIYILEQKTRPN